MIEMTDDQFFEFCQLNRDLRIEHTATGDLLILPPTGARTGLRNFRLITQLGEWLKTDQSGIGFDSSTGFILPNSASRSPDVSWIRRSRLASLADEEKEKFLPLCPDFVIELRSVSDSIADLKAKMEEYIENGAQMGLLLDPRERRAYIYRSGGAVEILDDAEDISCDPVLPGFRLSLREIWDADF
jgi:Uma2 family endonuclease